MERVSRQDARPALATARLSAALAATMLVGACGLDGTMQFATESIDSGGPPLAAAAMPRYEIGQTFIYSNRRVRRVVGIEGSTVRWQDHRGRESLTSLNPIVPTLHRETSSRIVSHRVFGDPDALWPLAVGKSVRFRVARTTIDKKDGSSTTVTRTRWCEVAGTQTVSVPAGQYDTYRIECDRQWGRRDTVKQRVSWYYAPALGHYVRTDKKKVGDQTVRTVELAAALDKGAATARRIKAIRKALKRRQADAGAAGQRNSSTQKVSQ